MELCVCWSLVDVVEKVKVNKINWKDGKQRQRYAKILSEEPENNRLCLLRKNISADLARENIIILNSCFKKALADTLEYFHDTKSNKHKKHIKRKAWWNEDNNSMAYAVYLDFSKAFDKVNRTKLLYKLMHYLELEIWLLIRNNFTSLRPR